jgi:GDP-4-dehydro-6-deoxy-D-mannose reductase
MRVLVTGATGFVGHHLCALLRARGHEVVGLVRPGGQEPVPEGIGVVTADITDVEDTRTAVGDVHPDWIAHLAGASSVGASFGAPVQTWDVNLGGTLALLEAARALRPMPRVLVVSSGEIYGQVPLERLPVDEHTPFRPLSPYGASKAAADLAALQYHLGYDLPAVRVRAFNHVGPGQDPRFVIPNVARQLAQAELAGRTAVTIRVGNVETRRDFTDVRDMVGAYVLLLERGDPAVPYLACTGRSVAVRHLVERLAELSPLEVTVESDPGLVRTGEQPDLYGVADRLRALGWAPETPLDVTLADTLESWRRAGVQA